MTKIKKVIYIIETRFNKRDYDRFGIEILKKNGFEVEVWDFTPFLGSHEYRRIEPPDPIKWDKLILFEEEKKALDALLGLDPSDAGKEAYSHPVTIAYLPKNGACPLLVERDGLRVVHPQEKL